MRRHGQSRDTNKVTGALRAFGAIRCFSYFAGGCECCIDVQNVQRFFYNIVERCTEFPEKGGDVLVGGTHLRFHHGKVTRLPCFVKSGRSDKLSVAIMAQLSGHIDVFTYLDCLRIAICVLPRYTPIGGFLCERILIGVHAYLFGNKIDRSRRMRLEWFKAIIQGVPRERKDALFACKFAP
ncbi:hypothetical protein CBM2615_B70193 [Cupriavidus taiwanensis]|uniref:Uncharacterized protein n=1 Tax=Cupriavidus taiwanensis TaxID=164546 RepID=A0A976G5A9_9BURK|nr:hypothetical protein CBM2614_B70097 [Cupriavidus taiwanensis]SOZ70316.1 hypothetical protein CBM2615_B70193 [Cupriavidus taiwanensis]SOZ73220.1 hypothetical protein CBM2613_B50326 [Cupriavidus taiwanensis]SPA10087.1 hypothetical protein CBM2625_B60242 [Cupriavidus taiwanensis]